MGCPSINWEKTGQRPAVYDGTGTKSTLGVKSRFSDYDKGQNLSVRCEEWAQRGYSLTRNALVCTSPLPPQQTRCTLRAVFKVLETTVSSSRPMYLPTSNDDPRYTRERSSLPQSAVLSSNIFLLLDEVGRFDCLHVWQLAVQLSSEHVLKLLLWPPRSWMIFKRWVSARGSRWLLLPRNDLTSAIKQAAATRAPALAAGVTRTLALLAQRRNFPLWHNQLQPLNEAATDYESDISEEEVTESLIEQVRTCRQYMKMREFIVWPQPVENEGVHSRSQVFLQGRARCKLGPEQYLCLVRFWGIDRGPDGSDGLNWSRGGRGTVDDDERTLLWADQRPSPPDWEMVAGGGRLTDSPTRPPRSP
ncbi:uncharacterized protein B0T23DRAFT_433768 [Neurospora hispaniola]|uniref:Uncharacterized protein n=1 Tax=Neurospora hispaniola TaxID=588809 RepID=A0AAJ0IEE8_9PEZI|nr:hypothetical protein B0T23DRAFT_433768 [Neurospora hispaniola]